MRKPIIAITVGDPGGVGPEVIAKCFRNFQPREDVHYILFGPDQPFEYLKKRCGIDLPLHEINDYSLSQLRSDKINFFNITPEAQLLMNKVKKKVPEVVYSEKGRFVFSAGRLSDVNACMTHAALKIASSYAAEGFVDALVTAPINKTAMRLLDPKFLGHTEFLAHASGVSRYAMMFVSERLKVTLATIHVPLKKVSGMITAKLVQEKIKLTDQFLRTYFDIPRPKIAVCALNPHGKETGTEEEAFILPAVIEARKKKIEVVGPLPADQLFHEAYEGRYDALISMYHDQALAPFKMIAFREGVNVTLGLPYIRTSPDHGTAFNIAYRGEADEASMQASLRLAERLLMGTLRAEEKTQVGAQPNLMTTQVELLKKYGLAVRGMMGQHLLIDPNIQRKIVKTLNLSEEDRVLEIGPGLGAITELILESGCQLTAVEKDPDFSHVLNEELLPKAPDRFTLYNEDILDFDLTQIETHGKPLKVISNIPYYITAPILMYLAGYSHLFSEAVLMMQKEVANRLLACPRSKDYGRLTLAVEMAAKTKHEFNVSASCFTPKPEIDSSVVKLHFHSRNLCDDPERVAKLVKIAFSQRRKTFAGLLAASDLGPTRERVNRVFVRAGFSKHVRGEELSLNDFIKLADLL